MGEVRHTAATDAGGATSALAERALQELRPGDVVGLGTGRAASAFVRALGLRVQAGLQVRGVATSNATAELARHCGIPLTSLEAEPELALAVDGADEVDPQLDLLKGWGGALVRERVVAAAARRFVVLVGEEKLVPVLGSRGHLPLEVVPFAVAPCLRWLRDLGLRARPREHRGRPVLSDNGNAILDCEVSPIADAPALERSLQALPGVVGSGLFLGMADCVLVEHAHGVEARERTPGAGPHAGASRSRATKGA